MSPPYESSRRRGVWNHWVPLAVTVTVATVGVAAWVWSQRKDEDHEEPEQPGAFQDLDYDNADYGDNPPYGASRDADPKTPTFGAQQPRSGGGGDAGFAPGQPPVDASSSGWAALRRTPSPQQFFDSAKRTVAAGVTAAGAAVGSALAAIREEDKSAYADHETWSEEADAKQDRAVGPSQSSKDAGKRRKKVAIVISADNHLDEIDGDGFHEHAVNDPGTAGWPRFRRMLTFLQQSILSHIPRQLDYSKIRLYVLIYAPNLKDTAVDAASNLPPPSLSSSFSNIDHPQTQTTDEARSPL